LLAGGRLSGSGELDLSGSTWVLGGDFEKDGGILSDNQTNLALSGNSILTSDEALSFDNLTLNDFTLTLGSPTSDLTVQKTITIDASTEGISTGGADLILLAPLNISNGGVSSTGGIVSLSGGGQLSGTGRLDVSGGNWILGGDFVKSSGTLTQTNLLLAGSSITLTSDEGLSFVNLNLNDYALTLGSSTSDLTVQNTITIDASTEGISTGGADLILLAPLNISNGGVASTGGIVSLSVGGQLSGTGILDVSGSTWVLGGDFEKSSGTLTISETTDLALSGSSTLTSDVALNFNSLNLNDFTLTLGSPTTNLTVENDITIDTSTEGISTGEADLLLSALTLSAGDVTSTGGIVSLSGGGQLSGTGKLDVSGSTLTLGGVFVKSNGTLTISETTDLALSGSSTLTSDVSLSFENLNLNNFTLTLGSSTSDLTVENAITIDSSGEGILTGEADLILLSSLNMSQGLLGSTGGTWVLSKDFLKSGGTLTISQTDLELKDSIKLTSDQALSFVFVTLNLNNFTLTLGSSTSDLTVINAITIDAITEGISTGEADLILLSSFIMSDGKLESSGGTIKFARGQTSIFSGNACMMLDETLLTSDDGIGIAFIEIDGEPDLSMTDSSQVSYITLSITSGTTGSISTAGGVDCLDNCTGFIETGAYGFNTHGLYRKVTSANWMLSESIGERKTATLAVKLLSRPLSDVEVILSSSDSSEATLSGNTLTDSGELSGGQLSGTKKFLSFTPSTWNRVQELTITGEDDDVSDYDVRVRIL